MRQITIALLFLFAYTSATVAQQPAAQDDEAEKKFATVGGRLTDANTGEPVRKATLSLVQMPSPGTAMTGPRAATTVTSDSEGRFSFQKLEPGTYMLDAAKTGYVRQQYGSRGGQFGGSNLVLKAGDKFASLDFRIPRQAVITGKVLDEDGEPVPNAMVSTMRQQPFGRQPQMIGGQSTNDLGEFRVANLTPGKYFIRVQKGGYFGAQVSTTSADDKKDEPKLHYVPTYYPNATDVASAAPIVVSSGQQVDEQRSLAKCVGTDRDYHSLPPAVAEGHFVQVSFSNRFHSVLQRPNHCPGTRSACLARLVPGTHQSSPNPHRARRSADFHRMAAWQRKNASARPKPYSGCRTWSNRKPQSSTARRPRVLDGRTTMPSGSSPTGTVPSRGSRSTKLL
jgi:protocatechuate 3,4-dioxygenase beta subunit